jgi:hypothetical protein
MQDYGTETCGGYPGSLGYLSIDAQAARPYTKKSGRNIMSDASTKVQKPKK